MARLDGDVEPAGDLFYIPELDKMEHVVSRKPHDERYMPRLRAPRGQADEAVLRGAVRFRGSDSATSLPAGGYRAMSGVSNVAPELFVGPVRDAREDILSTASPLCTGVSSRSLPPTL